MSEIWLALFNTAFMGLTIFWGAWYSLSAKNAHDFKATMMPIILALPRMGMVVASLLVGHYIFRWSNEQAITFVAVLMTLWLLLTTGEILYVQTKLRR